MTADVPMGHVLVFAGMLFCLGLLGMLARRNIIYILMSVEIMLNAAGIAFVAAGAHWAQPDGQVFFMFILAMAGAEVAIGLALVLRYHQQYQTLDADAGDKLHG